MAAVQGVNPEHASEGTETEPEINVTLYRVPPTQPIVQISDGRIRGTHVKTTDGETSYYSFLGIPYAKPPVGRLRFCPPEPPDPWNYRKNALKEPNHCIQYDPRMEVLEGDEDCLYLNVFTPKLPGCCSKYCDGPCLALLPVMVYIHGGDFTYGNGVSVDQLGPEYFVKNKVVFVSFNYRLGIFGFLSLNRKEAPGNMGLKDQVMALQWVKTNIASFFGDPDNVTIFGADAGAASVNYHLISPMSKGLFHKAIAQSGSALQHWAFNRDIMSLAFKIAELNQKEIKDEKQLYIYLMSLKDNDLVKSAALAVKSMKHKGGVYFGFVPTIEVKGNWKHFLTNLPYGLLESGKFNKVPYIAGFCSREGLTVTTPEYRIISGMVADKNLLKRLPFNITGPAAQELRVWLKDIYLTEMKRQVSNPFLLDELDPEELGTREDFAIEFLSDVDYIAGMVVSTALIAKHNTERVYLYEYTFEGAMNLTKQNFGIKLPGTVHGDELGYMFTRNLRGKQEDIGCCDRKLRERFTQMWTNFARYGNPTPKHDATITYEWLPISDAETMDYLEIGEYFTMSKDPYPERMELYHNLYSTLREADSRIQPPPPPPPSEEVSEEKSEGSQHTLMQKY